MPRRASAGPRPPQIRVRRLAVLVAPGPGVAPVAGVGVEQEISAPREQAGVEFEPLARGSDAVLIVGFVANEDLPAGVAPDTGPIGGFFVAKNSWRTTWGDCGLVYLSSAFLDTYGTAYVALGID